MTIYSIQSTAQTPLFPNSVVSNDIDFILDTDEDAFTSLSFIGQEDKEMPDSQSSILFDEDTYVFEATFSNGKKLGIWCHSSFGSQAAAEEYADKLCPRLGKLPFLHLNMLDHVVVHNGNATAFAETEGNFFVLYSQNMDARISTHDLEETVFHESVHASIQEVYEDDPVWTNAQSTDPTFVTDYAQSLPGLEDMAESALFAYALITTPGRLTADIEDWLETNIPNRLAFFRTLYSAPTSVQNTLENLSIYAYPNPANDNFTILLDELKRNTQLEIFSAAGVLVKSTPVKSGQNVLLLDALANGVYLLKIPGYKILKLIKQ